MSRMLPYPGRYESHDSWMRRCDSWERERKMWNSCRATNWGGNNYRAVQGPQIYSTPKPYIGIKPGGKRELFRASTGPTEELFGSRYNAVIGPFRTVRGAKFCNANIRSGSSME